MIVSTTATNLLVLLINVATSILAARLLGPEGRGQLALVLLYPQMIATMSMIGLDRSFAILGGRNRLSSPVVSIVILTMVLTIPVILLAYFVVINKVEDPSLIGLSVLYILYVPALYLFMFSSSLFNGLGLFIEYNVSRLSYYGSYLALIIVFWIFHSSDLSRFVYANLISVYVVMLISSIFLVIAKVQGKFEARKSAPKNIYKDFVVIFKKAALFVIPGILVIASGRIDQIIVSSYLEIKYLGLLVVYLAFSQLISPIANAVNVKVFHIGITGSQRNIAQLIRVSIFIYLIGTALLYMLAPMLVNLLYGMAYVEDISAARYLILAAFFLFCSKIFNEFMLGQSKIRQDVISNILFLISLSSISYWLIPVYHFLGMTLAMLIASVLRFLYIVMEFRKTLKVSIVELLFVKKDDIRWAFQKAKTVILAKIQII